MVEYDTPEKVLMVAREAVGIPFGRMDVGGRLNNPGNKGGIGQVIEEGHFHYTPNNDAGPDFPEAGVELKVAPYRRNQNGTVSAKERMVLNIVDYNTEYARTFEGSSFWTKNQCILMMLYEHLDDISREDLSISHAFLYSYPKEDLAIIRTDWEQIVEKIRAGLAHELSESDTLYLGVCTKGTDATSCREQPFSSEPAKQRAYCFKQSYMTGLLRRFVFGDQSDERIIRNVSDLVGTTLEKSITLHLSPYFGRTRSALMDEFHVGESKDANERIVARILGVAGKISETAEFKMAQIVPKTVVIRADGSPKESMSFRAFSAKELVRQDWERSDLKEFFETTRFMLIVFRRVGNRDPVFEGVKFWNMPLCDLEEVKTVWERTVQVLRHGVRFEPRGGRMCNNLPKSTENRVAHVRPHARDSEDTDELPNGQTMTKQSFWLNRTYITEILSQPREEPR